MNRRVIAATSTVLALGLATTACGGGGSNAEDGTDGKGKTLTVWVMEGTNPDAKPFFKEASAAFEKKTGAKVKVEYQQWASAQRKFTTAIEGGADQVPDVAEVGTTWVPGFADKGALVDVSKEVEKAGLTNDLVSSLKDAGTLNGKQYGMPWYAGVRSVLYRKDIFEKHGLKPPTNWQELRSAALKLKKDEPKMLAFPVAGGAEMFAAPFIWGAGGQLAVQKGGKWKSAINSKKAVEGITYYTDLARKDKLSPAKVNTWTEKEVGDAWNKGEVAMSLSGNWTPKAFMAANPDLKGKLGAVPIPGQKSGMSPSFLGGSYLSAFKTDKQALSWEFIKLLTTGKFAKKWAEQSSYLPPTNTDLDNMPDGDDPLVKPFVTQFKDAGASVPKAKSYTEIQATQVVPKMVQSILSGKSTPQQAADKAAKEMDAIFAKSE
ncbi:MULTISPECIES: sugar ABC transporter substrate-binding protein [unclassified Streptomyces]|uniref:sugar ABC transporter substrate-binding protein n=1 Tax=unclassified Streptomyces TaxID=2593676 RepID=UPI00278C7976|nr:MULTISPECIES: sugar ABC transporter substrate-binding protein [unclassified Streptomyces]